MSHPLTDADRRILAVLSPKTGLTVGDIAAKAEPWGNPLATERLWTAEHLRQMAARGLVAVRRGLWTATA